MTGTAVTSRTNQSTARERIGLYDYIRIEIERCVKGVGGSRRGVIVDGAAAGYNRCMKQPAAAAAVAQSAAYSSSPAGEDDRHLIASVLTQLGQELGTALPQARRLRTGVRVTINVAPNMKEAEIELLKRVRVRLD